MEEQILRAKTLIQEKRYIEARQLLKDVDHPKAQEWLNKIDSLLAEETTVEAVTPIGQDPFASHVSPAVSAQQAGEIYAPVTPLIEPEHKNSNIFGAIIGAILGAIISNILWILVAYFSAGEDGFTITPYASILGGALSGILALKLSGGTKNSALVSFIAVLGGALGVVLGYYSAYYAGFLKMATQFSSNITIERYLQEVPPFDPEIIQEIIQIAIEEIEVFDVVFLGAAILVAFATSRHK